MKNKEEKDRGMVEMRLTGECAGATFRSLEAAFGQRLHGEVFVRCHAARRGGGWFCARAERPVRERRRQ